MIPRELPAEEWVLLDTARDARDYGAETAVVGFTGFVLASK